MKLLYLRETDDFINIDRTMRNLDVNVKEYKQSVEKYLASIDKDIIGDYSLEDVRKKQMLRNAHTCMQNMFDIIEALRLVNEFELEQYYQCNKKFGNLDRTF